MNKRLNHQGRSPKQKYNTLLQLMVPVVIGFLYFGNQSISYIHQLFTWNFNNMSKFKITALHIGGIGMLIMTILSLLGIISLFIKIQIIKKR